MKLVSNFKEIEKNFSTLESYNDSSNSAKQEKYKSLIRKGTCFIVYKSEAGISFAPSRFIGYKNNSIEKHHDSDTLDGRETNKAINLILNKKPHANVNVEKYYYRFCKNNDIKATKTGSFGVPRKYWVLPNIDVIDDIDTIIDDIDTIKDDDGLSVTEKQTLIKARKGQGKYRKSLLKYWSKCVITGCEDHRLLRASHIKPWKYSDNIERLDVYNGLLLSPNYDLLFDQGLISFSNKGNLLLSKMLTKNSINSLNIDKSASIDFDKKHASYIGFHRKHIFK